MDPIDADAQARDAGTEATRADLLTLIGGHFSPDAVGPDRYAALLDRVRARAADYLDLAEPMLLEDAVDPAAQSELHVSRLLQTVRDLEPDRTRALAEQLLARIDAAAADTASLTDAGPDEADRIAGQLAQRRAQLAEVLGDTDVG